MMVHRIIIVFLLWMVGISSIMGGLWGMKNLYQDAQTHVQTTGEVKKVETQKIYRYRKIRYKQEMVVAYSTERYGELYVTVPSYYPFRKAGDQLVVWYHPDHPRDICFPKSECWLWGSLLGVGLLLVGAGIWGRKWLNLEKSKE